MSIPAMPKAIPMHQMTMSMPSAWQDSMVLASGFSQVVSTGIWPTQSLTRGTMTRGTILGSMAVPGIADGIPGLLTMLESE